ncbi:MAG TPA: hydroxymethylbilane synthase [Nitrospiraceae bacterium]|nr:hydroxymethylbilane synthase [Nitrospiraceae bacterium]
MSTVGNKRSTVVLGTRGSRLAVQQSEWVQGQLQAMAPHVTVTLRKIQTSGDKTLDVPLAQIGGKGLFVKEIEEALLSGEIDLAVHSMKDVPTELPEGLAILCVPPREDPRDALISRDGQSFQNLPRGARIGTSSLRRQSQLLYARTDLTIAMLRGNLDTRLKKLRAGQFDAIVLAAAGLRRLGWAHEITEYLAPEISLSAIGQGALGIEGRRDDLFIHSLLSGLDHAPSKTAVLAERALLHRLEGGCQVPIAAHATVVGTRVRLEGLVSSIDGKELIRDTVEGTIGDPESIGIQLAERLLARGGDRILRAIYGAA